MKKKRNRARDSKPRPKPEVKIEMARDVYQENLKALRERYPELANLVQKTPDHPDFQWVRTGSNRLPNLLVKPAGFFYYDAEDPIKDSADQMSDLGLKNAQLALFLGIGLGYDLIYYVQTMAGRNNTKFLLVLEKEPAIFKAALKSLDLTAVIQHPAVTLMIGVNKENLYTQLRSYLAESSKFILLKAIKPVYHISALRLNKEYYLGALQTLRDSATHQILNFGNDPHDSLIGIENMLANLNEIVSNPGINLLFNKFQGKPAIIVATGPSLNKNKHFLKGLEDKAVIIAADASLKVMLEMGVKPHLVTSLERVPETVKLLEGFDSEQVQDVYLAACPVVRRELYQVYPGPRVIVYRNFDHFKWLQIDKGILDIKLSAGNMAFKVAEVLGCDPIILVGQDLAFSRDGRTHASGTAYGDKQHQYYNGEILEVMGNDGHPIQTTPVWYSFLKSYEMDLASYQGTCINCTEGGAFIQGTDVMPLQEVIKKYLSESFAPRTAIKQHLAVFVPEEAKRDMAAVLELADTTAADMENIIENCRAGVEAVQQHRDRLEACLKEPARLEPLRKHLPQIEREIVVYQEQCRKSYHTYQLFLAHVIQSYDIKFRMEMVGILEKYDDPDLAKVEELLRQVEWYAVIGDLTSICLEALQSAAEELRSCIMAAVETKSNVEGQPISQVSLT